jgi:4-hydroxybenzoate polyprenyltransferase
MVDKKDDLKMGIKSTAIFFGEADLQMTAIIQGIFIFGMLLVGNKFHLNHFYFLSVFFIALLFIRQIYLCRNHSEKECLNAFLNNNWVGFVIFCGIILSKTYIT